MLEMKLLGLAAIFVPAIVLTTIFAVVERIRSTQEEIVTRQAVVTHALERELGGVVAPIVRKRLWGPWELRLTVPFECPGVVESVLTVSRRALQSLAPAPVEIVLVPRSEQGLPC